MASLNLPPTITSTASAAYEQAILDAVASSRVQFTWFDVASEANGHTATFKVMADALRIDDTRINASATLAQQIADALGCLLPTPRLMDLARVASSIKVAPSSQPITSTVQAMKDHSARIDQQVAGRTGSLTPGKMWLIDNGLAARGMKDGANVAENYGFYYDGYVQLWTTGQVVKAPASTEAAVTPPLRVIQGRGWYHNRLHSDYSQLVQLPYRWCVVDGREMDLADVLVDPALAPLASHNGAFPSKDTLRQPGVATFACKLPAKHPAMTVMSETGICPNPGPPETVTPPSRSSSRLLAVASAVTLIGGGLWLAARYRT